MKQSDMNRIIVDYGKNEDRHTWILVILAGAILLALVMLIIAT